MSKVPDLLNLVLLAGAGVFAWLSWPISMWLVLAFILHWAPRTAANRLKQAREQGRDGLVRISVETLAKSLAQAIIYVGIGLAVVGSLGVLAPELVGAPAFAQAGSTGGTIGKTNKSVSGGGEGAVPKPRAKSHSTNRASVELRSEVSSGSAEGTWAVSATPSCLPAWSLTVSVSNGRISGDGAAGQVSRGGAVRGNAVVLGFRFDFVGHFRGRQASGTLVGPNGCPGQWTAMKS